MSDKKVVIDLTFTMLMSVPSNWTAQNIEFWLNDSSHCLANEIATLQEEENKAEESCCFTCHRASAKYVRDALDSDIANLTPPKDLDKDNVFWQAAVDEADKKVI